MRINFLQKTVIISKIALVSIYRSLLVILISLFSKNKQPSIGNVIHHWALQVLNLAKVKYKIFNPDHLEFSPGRPYIIMSNHASHFDIPLIYTTFPKERVGMVAKKELFRIPIFGWGMRRGDCISLDRENKQQALADLEVAKERMNSGVRVWIAPEGTRSLAGKLGVFKKGGFKIALDVRAIIIPVTIVGSNKILPTKTFDLSVGELVEIYVGKPIDTINYQPADLQKLMTDTIGAIAAKL